MEMSEEKLPEDYEPHEGEEYMNDRQLAYFRRVLVNWRNELLAESGKTLQKLKEGKENNPETIDRGTSESDTAFELRTRDRYRKLLKKIEHALERIEEGEYGFCEETGEEIGLKRLMARPIATLSIEAQERHERSEKQRG